MNWFFCLSLYIYNKRELVNLVMAIYNIVLFYICPLTGLYCSAPQEYHTLHRGSLHHEDYWMYKWSKVQFCKHVSGDFSYSSSSKFEMGCVLRSKQMK